MAGMKRGALAASTLMLVATLLSACNQPYSQAPQITNTPIDPNSLFATPIGGATEMTDVEMFATQTAQAANPSVFVTPSSTGIGVTPQNPTATQTPIVSLPSTSTIIPTSTLVIAGSTSTAPPPGSRPSSYVLQREEFPYCIARRFNLDPESLLAQNHLSSGTVFYAGFELELGNVASPFPGVRALQPHPTTYVVTGNGDTTVYGVACKFGDVEPSAIVNANSSA